MQSLMAGQICAELVDLVSLAERVISGEEIEITESIEVNGVDVLIIFSGLKEFILTIEGSKEDMSIILRSSIIPDLAITLPTPVYVNLGEPVIMEDLC